MSPTTRTVIAVVLTIIIPGVGHMFVGRVRRGVVVLLLGLGLVAVVLYYSISLLNSLFMTLQSQILLILTTMFPDAVKLILRNQWEIAEKEHITRQDMDRARYHLIF